MATSSGSPRSSRVLLVLGALICVALGYLVGSRTGDAAPPPGGVPPRIGVETPRPSPPEPRQEPEPLRAPEQPSGVASRLPPGTPPQRVKQAEEIARRIRESARTAERTAEDVAARRVLEEMERERKVLEDQARGGPMALLRSLEENGGTRLAGLVASPERFAKLFEQKSTGPSLREFHLADPELLADGATIVLPPGVHDWRVSAFDHRKAFPRDLLFAGSGMDETLLRLDEIGTRQEIYSLTFRDLTLDCANHSLTDLRRDSPATIHLLRCRLVGFDTGAGGSVMLRARTAAFYAEDCRIESGFARSPGGGNLFRVGNGLLARMERCTFVGPFRSVYDRDNAATYHFHACSFERMSEQSRRSLEEPDEGVAFTDCSFSFLERGVQPKKRELEEINPAWRR